MPASKYTQARYPVKVQANVSRELNKDIEKIAERFEVSLSTVVRELLEKGLNVYKSDESDRTRDIPTE